MGQVCLGPYGVERLQASAMVATFEVAFVKQSWECIDRQLPSNGHWMHYDSDNGEKVMNRDSPVAWVRSNDIGTVSYKFLRMGVVAGTSAVRYTHCRAHSELDDVLIREVWGELILNVCVEPTLEFEVIVTFATMSGRVAYTERHTATSTLRCLQLRKNATTYLTRLEEISRQVRVVLVMGTTKLRGNCVLWNWNRYERFHKQSLKDNWMKLVRRVNTKTSMKQLTLMQCFRKVEVSTST